MKFFKLFRGQFVKHKIPYDHCMTSMWKWDQCFGCVFVPVLFLSHLVARKEKRKCKIFWHVFHEEIIIGELLAL